MAIFDRTHGGYRVFVGDLGSRVGKYELEREFEYYGPLIDVWVARNPPGFAFVVYKYSEDAEKSVRDLDGKVVCGRRVRVEHARPYEPRSTKRVPPVRSGGRSSTSGRGSSRRYRSRSRSHSRDKKRSRSRSPRPRRKRTSRGDSRTRRDTPTSEDLSDRSVSSIHDHDQSVYTSDMEELTSVRHSRSPSKSPRHNSSFSSPAHSNTAANKATNDFEVTSCANCKVMAKVLHDLYHKRELESSRREKSKSRSRSPVPKCSHNNGNRSRSRSISPSDKRQNNRAKSPKKINQNGTE